MSDFGIRSWRAGDYEARLGLYASEYVDSGEGKIRQLYFQNGGTFFVGLIGRRIVATGGIRRFYGARDDIGVVDRVCVVSEFQRRGFGLAMLLALERVAHQRGYVIVCVHATIAQVALQSFYEKNSYNEVARVTHGIPQERIYYEKVIV